MLARGGEVDEERLGSLELLAFSYFEGAILLGPGMGEVVSSFAKVRGWGESVRRLVFADGGCGVVSGGWFEGGEYEEAESGEGRWRCRGSWWCVGRHWKMMMWLSF